MTTDEPDEFLTTEELAAYLKVPVPTIRGWRHFGTGPAGVRLGRHVRYRRSVVEAWIDEQTRNDHYADKDPQA